MNDFYNHVLKDKYRYFHLIAKLALKIEFI